jgi:hypothetical protein
MPVILATQLAGIRMIRFEAIAGQIVHETLSWKYPTQNQDWWSGLSVKPWVQFLYLPRIKNKTKIRHMPVIPAAWEAEIRIVISGQPQVKSMRPYLKHN